MVLPSTHPFAQLQWHRVLFSLVNIRASETMSAHPLSIVQAIVKGVNSLCGETRTMSENDESAEPLMCFHIKERKHTAKMKKSAILPVEVLLFQKKDDDVQKWNDALQQYLSDSTTGKNFDLCECSQFETRNFNAVAEPFGATENSRELCLEFFTPVSFHHEKGKQRTYISKSLFVSLFEKRFSRLFGKKFAFEDAAEIFTVHPYFWNYSEIRHSSVSQPRHIQLVKGCVGKLYLKGEYSALLPWLILGSEIHTGNKLSNGQGYYKLHCASVPFFDSFFPSKKTLLPVLHETLERYDYAAESLSITEQFPFNENQFIEKLCGELKEQKYIPTPSVAFLVQKKDGSERLVEKPALKDLIVQQYVYRTIVDFIDRSLEEESIGFRKGISRHKAIDIVKKAIEEGYKFVIESDIEDFFPSVDLHRLLELMQIFFVQHDTLLLSVLQKIVLNGYLRNGNICERTKGLAQGSPLSPLLANLYLDAFDETIQQWGVRFIRYADDFIILAKTEQDAEKILVQTEQYLSTIGLFINRKKTAIKPISSGFQFLGISFEHSEITESHEQELQLLKKPLYVTQPFFFLGLNGDAIEIRKGQHLVDVFPLRNISEIIVMEKSSFSTSLIHKCTTLNIPVTIILNTGYYVTTIKPDSKKYYDIATKHSHAFNALSPTEILAIAKDIVAAKIQNYRTLFLQRYEAQRTPFLRAIEDALRKISIAEDIAVVRGIEGALAKKVFMQLNTIIENPIFHITKRERKKPDRINSLMNFCSYLLFSRINATVRAIGLNPYLGFLHSPEDSYESLVADVQEVFRARFDRFLVRILNLKIIVPEDFTATERGYFLSYEATKKFLDQFETEMEREKKQNALSLKENIYTQAQVIKRWACDSGTISFYIWNV